VRSRAPTSWCDAGPPDDWATDGGDVRLVRPYALTGGRTRARVGDLPLEALVVTTRSGTLLAGRLRHEPGRILELCREPMSIAELSARLAVPLGVARVLVGDLVGDGHVEVHRATVGDARPDVRLLERVLDGLQAL
jgi:Protein of unknown function (DUF742)